MSDPEPHVQDRDDMAPGEAALRREIKRWGVARVAYAAAHNVEPGQVEPEDDGLNALGAVLHVSGWMNDEDLAEALGMDVDGTPDDGALGDFIADLREAANR